MALNGVAQHSCAQPHFLRTCVGIKILRRVRAESSRRPPRHRRDACSMAWRCRFLAAAPDALVAFHTVEDVEHLRRDRAVLPRFSREIIIS